MSSLEPKEVEKEDVNDIIQRSKGDTEKYHPQDAALPEESDVEFKEDDLLDEWRETARGASDSLSSQEDTRVYKKSGTALRESFEEQYA